MRLKPILIILSLFLIPTFCFATDQTASSCAPSDIKKAVDTCYNTGGGTVTLPACKGGSNGSTWTSGMNLCIHAGTKELRIIGAGEDQTVIQYANGAGPDYSCTHAGWTGSTYTKGDYLLEVTGSGFKELGNLSLKMAASSPSGGPLFIGGCDCFGGGTMDHARFHHMTVSGENTYICWDANTNSSLLLDHVNVRNTNGGYGIRIHGNNDVMTWEDPPVYGTDKGVFIEDSTFDGTYHPIAGHGSAIYTVRHNTFSNTTSAMEGHGPSYQFGCMPGTGYGGSASCADTYDCYQGVQRVDAYNNTFNSTMPYSTYSRSGTWAIHNNTFIGQDTPIHIEMEGASQGPNCTEAKGCPYEVTTVNLSKACGSAGIDGCWQAPSGIYIWNNDFQSCTGGCSNSSVASCVNVSDKGSGCVRQGHEWFLRAPQAGDPRVTSYTEFTYPHPLQSGEGPPSAPKELRIIE
jgi:hypothetical protein